MLTEAECSFPLHLQHYLNPSLKSQECLPHFFWQQSTWCAQSVQRLFLVSKHTVASPFTQSLGQNSQLQLTTVQMGQRLFRLSHNHILAPVTLLSEVKISKSHDQCFQPCLHHLPKEQIHKTLDKLHLITQIFILSPITILKIRLETTACFLRFYWIKMG